MISVSMCMIVKNEQSILKRCLDSYAGIYDELIIVDTGSTDNTLIRYMTLHGVMILLQQEILLFQKPAVTIY